MPTGTVDDEVTKSRILRLKQEFEDENVPLGPDELPQSELVAEEVIRARHVKVHEGMWPAYGAVISAADALPSSGEFGVTTIEGEESVRAFANGIDSFVIRSEDGARPTAIWVAPSADELLLVSIARKNNAIFVQRTQDGLVKVITNESIWVNAGYTWVGRPTARSRIKALTKSLGVVDREKMNLVAILLDFTFHRLSPRGIGATLVFDVMGDSGFESAIFSAAGESPPLAINFMNEPDLKMMTTFLSAVDGACLIDSSGNLTRTKVHLGFTDRAMQKTTPLGGTRHSSAIRFSYDHPEAIVFVVSADGPVTLFSSGVASTVLTSRSSRQPNTLDIIPSEVDGVSRESKQLTCDGCAAALQVDLMLFPSADSMHVLKCPVCGKQLMEARCNSLDVRPLKPWEARI